MVNKKYFWVDKMSRDDLLEFIGIGNEFSFQYKGKDYSIEGNNFDNEAKGRVGFYYIQDPDIQEDGSCGKSEIHYPESMKAKTPEELINLPFLDGKTIFEAFDELKFFD